MAGVWIVGCVKSHCEQQAAENISRQGYENYMPYVAESRVQHGHKFIVGRPLFQGYTLIDIENRPWKPLLSTRGLFCLLGSNKEKPSVLPDGTVEEIRSRENEAGLIVLPKLVPGSRVRVIGGHLENAEGIYEGMQTRDRVKLFLEYLDRKRTVLISRELVRAID